MTKKEIILKITNDKIWFNDTDFVKISSTNIPFKYLYFNNNREIYWKVKMKEFDKSLKKLFVDIIDYSYINLAVFLSQKPKENINYLEFGSFNWELLEPVLSTYQKSKFIKNLTNIHYESNKSKLSQKGSRIETKKIDFNTSSISQVDRELYNKELINIKYKVNFAINFKDSVFILGFVRFSKFIQKINQTVDFKIANENILPEFDNIKYWFSKKLKTKKFNVKANFTIIEGKLYEFSAISKEIDKINKVLIEGVKVQRTIGITKSIRPQEVDKGLFTSDDLYSLDTTNDLEGNVFKQTEKDILELLIEKSNVRNKRELIYLSGNKQSLNYRIRFTNHPNFGFIFITEGELNNHFIWELLNSHATYIWTIEKGKIEIELQYKRIESTINTILNLGREKYKQAYKTTNQDSDLIFNVIYHKGKSSHLIDEFPKWKNRINELIT